ncbi:MAG TPA: hypothetical protein VFX49_17440 [Chloroflexota bacterium]|nr:hypothetical protein [Chloroflexota bacterium]
MLPTPSAPAAHRVRRTRRAFTRTFALTAAGIALPLGGLARTVPPALAQEVDPALAAVPPPIDTAAPVEPPVPPRPDVKIEFDWYSASVNWVSPHGHGATVVRPGDPVTVRLNTAATADAVFLIDVELYDDRFGASTAQGKLWQMVDPQYPFPANTPFTLQQTFAMPNIGPGRYRVHLGVFTPDWQHLMAWDDYVGFIELVA